MDCVEERRRLDKPIDSTSGLLAGNRLFPIVITRAVALENALALAILRCGFRPRRRIIAAPARRGGLRRIRRDFRGVVREPIAPDIPPVRVERPALDAIGVIALDNGNLAVEGGLHNADVSGSALVVGRRIVRAVFPIVENHVARLRDIGVVLFPPHSVLIERHHAPAPALGKDNIREPALERDRRDESRAPCVGVCDLVPNGER